MPHEIKWDGEEFIDTSLIHEAQAGNSEYGRRLLRRCAVMLKRGKPLNPVMAAYLGDCLEQAAGAKARDVAHCLNVVHKPGYKSPAHAANQLDRAKLVWELRPGVNSNLEAFEAAAEETGEGWTAFRDAWERWRKAAPFIFGPRTEEPGPQQVAGLVANAYRTTPSDLRGRKGGKGGYDPRMVAMYLCREVLKMTFQDIGDYFGLETPDDSEDAYGVADSWEKIGVQRRQRPELDGLLDELTKLLK